MLPDWSFVWVGFVLALSIVRDRLVLRPVTRLTTARAQLERDADAHATTIVERVRGRKA